MHGDACGFPLSCSSNQRRFGALVRIAGIGFFTFSSCMGRTVDVSGRAWRPWSVSAYEPDVARDSEALLDLSIYAVLVEH
eukprot:3877339-Pleurochrysis_carterae.AAC.1